MSSGKIADTNTRTNITIPKDLKAELELIATEQNRSFNNLVITVLKEFVAKNHK
jgi:predicted HicB family RNase H-like nuclease